MKIITTSHDLRALTTELKKNNTIGFVPTMGALHEGHLSLVRASKISGDTCIMSIFVNPTQFGPGEDFDRYPRPIEKDILLARESGVDVLFLPSKEEIYPTEAIPFITDSTFNKVMCGIYRPHFFPGVGMVVRRLLEIVSPDNLYLGMKDAQQVRILQELVTRYEMPVTIVPIPTFRERNGLAKSSRNEYLSVDEKEKASIIYKSLMSAKEIFDSGERNTSVILDNAKKILQTEKNFKLQYVELVQWRDFQPAHLIREKSVLAVAGFFGNTRLIDNVMLLPKS